MPKPTTKPWSREEHVLAFNLYCKIPFGTIHTRNPKIIQLAELLGRSAGAVSYKLANFARLDPTLQSRGIRGMAHGAKCEEEVWQEFAANGERLAYESEKLLAERTGTSLEQLAEIDESELPAEGLERERLVRIRVNQHFFRTAVLAAYNFRCCVSGLAVLPLLVASHIVPWSIDAKNRMNPRNGLCLNALHDRAFDRGLMTVTADFKVQISDTLAPISKADEEPLDWLRRFDGVPLTLPKKFPPDEVLLALHRKRWNG
jgi:putative restriction endonuclease